MWAEQNYQQWNLNLSSCKFLLMFCKLLYTVIKMHKLIWNIIVC